MTTPPLVVHIAVVVPLLVGTGITICTVVVHALAVSATVRLVRHRGRLGRLGHRFWADVATVVGVTSFALVAHLVDIGLWTAILAQLPEFPGFASALYQSAGNYTTLGGGPVAVSAAWEKLGPVESADGMLMFGLSTAMIFAVIQRIVQTKFRESS